ncbi:MAG: hypothetical protein AB8D78_04270 [Akkermansiaceae bacterium]
MGRRILQVVCVLLIIVLVVWIARKEPKRPGLPKWQMQERLLDDLTEQDKLRKQREADVALVRSLLGEELSDRRFSFAVISEAVSGKKVIPASGRASSERVFTAIDEVMSGLLPELSGVESPIRRLKRINEASRYFEEGLMEGLSQMEGFECEVPKTREGKTQRSGYPDLKITDTRSGDVFYLDPKLMEQGSVRSSLRTFYFEPKRGTLKITDDASHLLIGIEHDGKDGEWGFLGYRLVDLAFLNVRLKAEFQASNKNIYTERSVLESTLGNAKDEQR